MNKDISFIRLLRGVAPLFVLYAHLVPYFIWKSGEKWWAVQYIKDGLLRPLHLYQDGGHLGVILFFLVSGFIITHVSMRETVSEFIIKRVFRLLPVLILSTSLTAIYFLISNYLELPILFGTKNNLSVGQWIEQALLLNYPIGDDPVLFVTWTLFIEIIFYSITAILMPLSRNNIVVSSWLMFIFFFCLAVPALISPSLNRIFPFTIYLPFLLAGRSIYIGWSNSNLKIQSAVILAASVLLYYLVLSFRSYDKFFPEEQIFITHIIAFLLFFGFLTAPSIRVPKWLGLIADSSYSIYLLHLPIGMFLMSALTSEGVWFGFALIISLASIFSVSYFSYRLIERPMQKIGRSIIEVKLYPRPFQNQR